MKTMRRVQVTWIDTALAPGWGPAAETKQLKPAACMSVGFLLRRTRKLIQVAQSIGDDGDVADVLTIPRANVRKVKVLR